MSRRIGLNLAFLALFFLGFFLLLKHQGKDVAYLANLPAWLWLVWFPLIAIAWLTNGWRLNVLLAHRAIKLPVIEGAKIASAASLLNYLPLQGGLAARGFFLQRVYGLKLPVYAGLTLGAYAITFLTHCTVGLAVCLLYWQTPAIRKLFVLYLLIWIFCLLAVSCPLPESLLRRLPFGLGEKLKLVHEHFREILRDRHCLVRLIAMEFILIAQEYAKLFLVFTTLGLTTHLPWAAGVLMATLAYPAIMANITPAGIGVRESAIALVALTFGFTPADALLAGGLDRILTLVVVFLVGGFATHHLMHRFASK